MSGTGNNNFSPKQPYTREQSIITANRVLDAMKSGEMSTPGTTPKPTTTPQTTTTPKPTSIPQTTTTPKPTTTPATALTASEIEKFERKVFELTNIERAKLGLPDLIWNDDLATAARAHSEDLARNNMKGHTGSDGSTIAVRLSRVGISNTGWSENCVYGAATPEKAIEWWMNSQGHKENILREDSQYLGVGLFYLPGSQYGFYCTQNFITKLNTKLNAKPAQLEQELMDLTDSLRSEKGYNPVTWDNEMATIARALSERFPASGTVTVEMINAASDELSVGTVHSFNALMRTRPNGEVWQINEMGSTANWNYVIEHSNVNLEALGANTTKGAYGIGSRGRIVRIMRIDSYSNNSTPQTTTTIQNNTLLSDEATLRALEIQVVNAVNQVRQQNGLAPLVVSEELTKAARNLAVNHQDDELWKTLKDGVYTDFRQHRFTTDVEAFDSTGGAAFVEERLTHIGVGIRFNSSSNRYESYILSTGPLNR